MPTSIEHEKPGPFNSMDSNHLSVAFDAALAQLPYGDDVEVEQDAESLSSGESEGESAAEVEQIELFRFSRNGLSVWVDLQVQSEVANRNSTKIGDQRLSRSSRQQSDLFSTECLIANFEDLCRQRYPSVLIGCHVSRYSSAPGDDSVTLQNGRSATTVAPTTKGFSATQVYRKDRFSAVVGDIERRLNRQGFIGDPRAVCRKGGGRSGEYYEKDDSFFDDSEAFEQLGVEYSSGCNRSPPDSENDGEVDEDFDDSESDCDFDYYVAESRQNFTFDDDVENDAIDLTAVVIQAEGSTDETLETATSLIGASDRDAKQEWVDARGWRRAESKLPDYVRRAFVKLETAIEPLGDKSGIFVKERVVLDHLRNTIEEVFCLTYRKISWNIPKEYKEIIETTTSALRGEARSSCSIAGKSSTPATDAKTVVPSTTVNDERTTPDIRSEGRKSDGYDSEKMMVDCQTLEREEEMVMDCEGVPNEKIESTEKKKRMRKPTKKRRYRSEDLICLKWEFYDLFLDCLMRVTSVLKKKALDSLWIYRLVLHNALVYCELENDLTDFIFKQSILFRSKKSRFLRDVKKTQEFFQSAYETLAFHIGKSAPSTTSAQSSSSSLLDDATKSPFFPVAIELLNWGIIYNCRRNELKSIGFPVENRSETFPKYLCEKLNDAIATRRRDLSEKERIILKRLFIEETLKKFKQHFKISTLYERWMAGQAVPQFISPCKAIGLRGSSTSKPRKPTPASAELTQPQLVPSTVQEVGSGCLAVGIIPDVVSCARKRQRRDEAKVAASSKKLKRETPTVKDVSKQQEPAIPIETTSGAPMNAHSKRSALNLVTRDEIKTTEQRPLLMRDEREKDAVSEARSEGVFQHKDAGRHESCPPSLENSHRDGVVGTTMPPHLLSRFVSPMMVFQQPAAPTSLSAPVVSIDRMMIDLTSDVSTTVGPPLASQPNRQQLDRGVYCYSNSQPLSCTYKTPIITSSTIDVPFSTS